MSDAGDHEPGWTEYEGVDTGTDAPAQDAAPAADVVPPPAAAPQTFDADPGGKGDDIPSGPDAGSELHEEEDTRGDVPDTARHAAETATRGAAETGGPEAKAAGDDKGGKDTGAEAKDDAPEADAAPAPGTTGSSGTLNHGDEVSIDHDVRPGSSDDHGPAAATAGSGGETAGSGTAATTAETDDHGPAEPASEPADTGRPEAANKEPAAEDATTDGTEAAGDAADATAGGGTETGGPEADDHDDGTPGADGRDDAPADHEQVEDEDGAGGSEAAEEAGDDTEADTDAEPADDAGSGEAAGGDTDVREPGNETVEGADDTGVDEANTPASADALGGDVQGDPDGSARDDGTGEAADTDSGNGDDHDEETADGWKEKAGDVLNGLKDMVKVDLNELKMGAEILALAAAKKAGEIARPLWHKFEDKLSDRFQTRLDEKNAARQASIDKWQNHEDIVHKTVDPIIRETKAFKDHPGKYTWSATKSAGRGVREAAAGYAHRRVEATTAYAKGRVDDQRERAAAWWHAPFGGKGSARTHAKHSQIVRRAGGTPQQRHDPYMNRTTWRNPKQK